MLQFNCGLATKASLTSRASVTPTKTPGVRVDQSPSWLSRSAGYDLELPGGCHSESATDFAQPRGRVSENPL